ncbi:MAG: single-stranded DNA-binding protein [Treponema sp.]|nr:single-stranded DNA-binding protein [Treponema sp.]
MNHFTGVGRLTADAELNHTPGGTAALKFALCINDSYKKDGEWQERPYFFNCIVWGNYASAMHEYLTKGRLVGVEGKLTHNPWKDGNGTTHNDCSIVVFRIHLFHKPEPAEAGDETGLPNDPPNPPPEDGEPGEAVPYENLPF